MRWLGVAAFAGALFAQDAPIGIVRGDLMNWTGSPAHGEIRITNSAGQYRCGFDAKTYMEREGQRVAIAAFGPGDRVEAVTDRRPGSQVCYVRTLHAIEKTAFRTLPGHRPPLRRGPSPTEAWAPRGDLTFAGLVVRVMPEALILRTREEPRKTILLRQDTRYLSGGVRVDPDALSVNTRVFVRAGRNLDNDVEAYQVIWGDIVRPNED